MSENSIQNIALKYTQELSAPIQKLISDADKELAYIDMLSSKMELNLYQHLIRIGNYTRILELGMFIGASTLAFAEATNSNGRVTTIEPNKRYIRIAKKGFNESSYSHKIHIVEKHAKFAIPDLEQEYDFIFIDADKDNYGVYYDVLLPKLSKNGTLVIDNMFWYGKLEESNNRKAQVIHELNDQILEDKRVTSNFLPIRDGVVLIQWK